MPVRRSVRRKSIRRATPKRRVSKKRVSVKRSAPKRRVSKKRVSAKRVVKPVSEILESSYGLKDMFQESESGYKEVGEPKKKLPGKTEKSMEINLDDYLGSISTQGSSVGSSISEVSPKGSPKGTPKGSPKKGSPNKPAWKP